MGEGGKQGRWRVGRILIRTVGMGKKEGRSGSGEERGKVYEGKGVRDGRK